MIIKRIITAAVLIAIVLCGLFWLPLYVFKVMAGAVTLLGTWEISCLFWPRQVNAWCEFAYFAILFATITILIFFNLYQPLSFNFLLIVGAFWWLIDPLFLVQYVKKGGALTFNAITKFFIGFLVFIPYNCASVAFILMQF